jgi:hypothetical protein
VVVGRYQPLADNGAFALSHAGAVRPCLSSAVASEDKEEGTGANPLFFAFAKMVLLPSNQ